MAVVQVPHLWRAVRGRGVLADGLLLLGHLLQGRGRGVRGGIEPRFWGALAALAVGWGAVAGCCMIEDCCWGKGGGGCATVTWRVFAEVMLQRSQQPAAGARCRRLMVVTRAAPMPAGPRLQRSHLHCFIDLSSRGRAAKVADHPAAVGQHEHILSFDIPAGVVPARRGEGGLCARGGGGGGGACAPWAATAWASPSCVPWL